MYLDIVKEFKNDERYYKATEILGILHTLYHEIRHQKQQQHSENFNLVRLHS